MKPLLSLALVAGFAVLASAQAGAPAGAQIDPPLRPAPAITILRAADYTIHLGRDGGMTKTGNDVRMELLGPLEIRADEAEQFTSGAPDARLGTDDVLVLRGNVTVRSNPLVR